VGETLIALGDADHPDATGIFDRATRSWDAAHGKDPRDSKFRERRGRRFIASILTAPPIADRAQETVRLADGTTAVVGLALELNGAKLNALAEKWIRGLFYADTRRILNEDLDVVAFMPPSEHLVPVPGADKPPPKLEPVVANALDSLKLSQRVAPGLRYGWCLERDAKRSVLLWKFVVWGHVTIVAIAMPRLVTHA